MTVISNKYKIIFIHIPKCAGSSLRLAIKENDPNAIMLEHTSYIDLLKKYPNKTKNYLIFTIVRNTYDRLVSLYHYHKQNFHLPCFNNERLITLFSKPFDECLQSEGFKLYWTVNQIYWIKDQNNQIPKKINIFYLNTNLQEEINKLLLINNISLNLQIPYTNTSKHKNYESYYNKELVEYVKIHNKEEIEYFNFNISNYI